MGIHPKNTFYWFTYDIFDRFIKSNNDNGEVHENFMSSLGMLTVAVFCGMLAAFGGINGVWGSYEVAGTTFIICYTYHFFAFAHEYTDQHYLMWLLGILVVTTGGGLFFLVLLTTVQNPTIASPSSSFSSSQQSLIQQASSSRQQQKLQRIIQRSEWGVITLRFQFTIMYFFTVYYKWSSNDFWQGHILRQLSLPLMIESNDNSHDHQHQHQHQLYFQASIRLWNAVKDTLGPYVFAWMAELWIYMELGLLCSMILLRPTVKSFWFIFTASFLLHGTVALFLGHHLGYEIPFCCFLGALVFYPIGDETNSNSKKSTTRQYSFTKETNLLGWGYRYALGRTNYGRINPRQRFFTIMWVALQFMIPIRMILMSHSNYSLNGIGNIFSWTMKMHTKQTTLHIQQDKDTAVTIHLFYLVPECERNEERKDSMLDHSLVAVDPRTLRLDTMLSTDQRQFLLERPRYLSRVAGAMSRAIYERSPNVCGPVGRLTVSAVMFVKMNGNGPYRRIVDPSTDLITTEHMWYHRTWWATLTGILLDRALTNHEFVLNAGFVKTSTLQSKIDYHSKSSYLREYLEDGHRIEFVSDHSACLASRPLALWPNSVPLGIIPLEVPDEAGMYVVMRDFVKKSGVVTSSTTVTFAADQWNRFAKKPTTIFPIVGNYSSISGISVEIYLRFYKTGGDGSRKRTDCMDATESREDLLFALIF